MTFQGLGQRRDVKHSKKTGFDPGATRGRDYISFSWYLSGVCGMADILSKKRVEK